MVQVKVKQIKSQGKNNFENKNNNNKQENLEFSKEVSEIYHWSRKFEVTDSSLNQVHDVMLISGLRI